MCVFDLGRSSAAVAGASSLRGRMCVFISSGGGLVCHRRRCDIVFLCMILCSASGRSHRARRCRVLYEYHRRLL